jgi:hypothetical protein
MRFRKEYSYSMGDRIDPQGQSRRGEKLTAHLHLMLGLRMAEAILLLLLHNFLVWAKKTLPLHLLSFSGFNVQLHVYIN